MHDSSGTIAVWSALIAMPLLMAVTYSLDLKWAESNVTELKASADFAVLAAVSNNAIPLRDKDGFATEIFLANYSGKGEPRFDIDVDAKSVRMAVRAEFPQTLTQMIGLNTIDASVASRAELTTQQIICVLALNPDKMGAIAFKGDVEFSAPTCSVYANSTHNQAVVAQGTVVPRAKGFCAGGGADGAFEPYANSQCRQMADPYAGKQAPVRGDCETAPAVFDVTAVMDSPLLAPAPRAGRHNNGENRWHNGNNPINAPLSLDSEITTGGGGTARSIIGTGSSLVTTPGGTEVVINPGDSPNIVDDLTVLQPGTYCGGLTIAGDRVRMRPGEYYMNDGPFVVKDGADVSGSGVIIALGGKKAVMKVEDQGKLELSAPTLGAFEGIVVMQDVRNQESDQQGNPKKLKSKVGSGGELVVTGTVYLPTHKLEVKGDGSRVGARAPSTSFIADTVEFKGSGRITVAVNHEEAGLPPVLPRSEDGARLTE